MRDNDNIQYRLGNLCINRFRYMRLYHDRSGYLNGLSDNGWRLFRAMLLFSDVEDGCVHLYVKAIKVMMIEYAYVGIEDTDYNYRRRYYRGLVELEAMDLVRRFRNGYGRCVMVNPLVGYMADYRGRKAAIVRWDQELMADYQDRKKDINKWKEINS